MIRISIVAVHTKVVAYSRPDIEHSPPPGLGVHVLPRAIWFRSFARQNRSFFASVFRPVDPCFAHATSAFRMSIPRLHTSCCSAERVDAWYITQSCALFPPENTSEAHSIADVFFPCRERLSRKSFDALPFDLGPLRTTSASDSSSALSDDSTACFFFAMMTWVSAR